MDYEEQSVVKVHQPLPPEIEKKDPNKAISIRDAQQTRAQILSSAHENAARAVHHFEQAIEWLQLIEKDTKERYRKTLTTTREFEEHIEELRSVYTSKVQ